MEWQMGLCFGAGRLYHFHYWREARLHRWLINQPRSVWGLTATLFIPIAGAMMLAVQKLQEFRLTLKAEELARPSIGRGGREWGLTVGRELILPQSEEELLHDWNRRLATYYIYEILLFRWECKEFVWNKSNEMIRKPRVKSCLRRKSSVAWFRK